MLIWDILPQKTHQSLPLAPKIRSPDNVADKVPHIPTCLCRLIHAFPLLALHTPAAMTSHQFYFRHGTCSSFQLVGLPDSTSLSTSSLSSTIYLDLSRFSVFGFFAIHSFVCNAFLMKAMVVHGLRVKLFFVVLNPKSPVLQTTLTIFCSLGAITFNSVSWLFW